MQYAAQYLQYFFNADLYSRKADKKNYVAEGVKHYSLFIKMTFSKMEL